MVPNGPATQRDTTTDAASRSGITVLRFTISPPAPVSVLDSSTAGKDYVTALQSKKLATDTPFLTSFLARARYPRTMRGGLRL